MFPFQTLADLVSPTDGISKKKHQDTVDLTSWAVRMVSYHISGARCLVQALAMMAMLKYAGISSTLCIGVAKEGGSPFEAHAWVEIDGNAVIGGPEPEKFTKLGNVRCYFEKRTGKR